MSSRVARQHPSLLVSVAPCASLAVLVCAHAARPALLALDIECARRRDGSPLAIVVVVLNLVVLNSKGHVWCEG